MKTKYRDTSRKKTPWDNKSEVTPLEAFIKSNYLDSFEYHHQELNLTNEHKLFNSFSMSECRLCQSNHIIKYGYTKNGIQRYKCLECGNTFTVLTGTLFENHKISISEWIEFCLDIFRYESINITSKSNKNSYTTSKYWLNKLFLLIEDIQNDIILNGKVWIDETYYRVIKSDKTIVNGKELRGISKNQYCIAIGYDGTTVCAQLEGKGKPSQKKTEEAFLKHIQSGSHLIHDCEKSHKVLVEKLNLTEEKYNSNEVKKLEDKDNPLNPINRQCYLLQRFLNSHSGFDREDLQNYLNLFCFIQNEPHEPLEKVEKLLFSATHLTKSLTFRQFYAKK